MVKKKKSERVGQSNARRYPIREVARLTGVHPITLRAWESRYGLIKPQRSPGGHRLYSEQDVAIIRQAMARMADGDSISRAMDALRGPVTPAGPETAASHDQWRKMVAKATEAVERFDAPALDRIYDEALSLHPAHQVTEHLMLPLLWQLGNNWECHAAGIAEEHFFSTHLRNRLGARLMHHPQVNGPLLVLACLPGERHETGLLLFALAASGRGIRVVFLGADIPLSQVAETARRLAADGVVLSATYKPRRGLLKGPLTTFVRNLKAPVFVGGPVSLSRKTDITEAGAESLGVDIPAALAQIAHELGI